MSKVYSVRELNSYFKKLVQSDLLLGHISVRGEVSNFKDHPSGHLYFTLKDEGSQIAVVMFAGNRVKGLRDPIKEGDRIVVTGSVDVYEAGGKYQLYATKIEPEGTGDLFLKFQELKTRLEEAGFFDPSYKKPIPKYITRLGVVTAESGAAFQDVIRVTRQRNPHIEIILSPALVQGEGAPASIVRAIELLDALHPDVMIVGRGGGSMEDLWCFNDERVAKAIFDTDTPVISAVGHEVDFTIADFVADYRAATPSQAAEVAVFEYNAYLKETERLKDRMADLLSDRVDGEKLKLKHLEAALNAVHPKHIATEQQYRLSELEIRLKQALKAEYEARKQRLALLSERLSARSPLARLSGGYGYVSVSGRPVNSIHELKAGDDFYVTVSDGTAKGVVTEIKENENHGK